MIGVEFGRSNEYSGVGVKAFYRSECVARRGCWPLDYFPIGGYSMPRMTDKMLDSGDLFPRLELDKIGGGKLSLPGDLAGDWGAVLLYRGHW